MKLPFLMVIAAAACGGSSEKTTTTTTTKTSTSEPVMVEEESVAEVIAAESEPPPAATEPPPNESPPVERLDKDSIRLVIRRNLKKIRYCYEKELMQKPSLQGTTTVSFTITPSGQVEAAIGSGLDATVDLCVANVIGSLTFPPATFGTQVNYPFKFSQGGAAVDPPTP